MSVSVDELATLPLCRIFRMRKVWRSQGKTELVALAEAAIERRIAIVCGEVSA